MCECNKDCQDQDSDVPLKVFLEQLFAAFDRPHYQKLIPCHLHEALLMPQDISDHFESGAFVCSVTGCSVRSIALDEAH